MYTPPITPQALSGLSGFDDAIQVIWKRVNWNTGSAECRETNACYPQNLVKRILEVYNGAAKAGKVAIYSTTNGQQVCAIVSSLTNIPAGQVCAVLKELHDATVSGKLDSQEYLRPLGAKEVVATNQKSPSDNPNVHDNPGSASALLKNPWVIGALVTAVGTGFIVYKAHTMKASRRGVADDVSSAATDAASSLTYDYDDEVINVYGANGENVTSMARPEAEASAIVLPASGKINYMKLRSHLISGGNLAPTGNLKRRKV